MTIVIPIYVIYLIAWYIVGFFGALLLYVTWTKEFPEEGFCPSPICILGVIVGSALGLGLFVASLIATAIIYFEKPSWWNTPICKKRLTNDD